jgi:hypothetical protein
MSDEKKPAADANQPVTMADLRKFEDKMKGWVRYEMDLAARGIQQQERMEKHNP